jgi:hypothetical protein
MVRERRKWLLQLKKFGKQSPTLADAQHAVPDHTFSPELAAVLKKDLEDLAFSTPGRVRRF